MFQFLIGTLKTLLTFLYSPLYFMFQFLIGTLKTIKQVEELLTNPRFNSL